MYSSPRSFSSEQGLNNILECNVQFRQIQDILFSPAINVFPVRRVSNPHFLADILKKVSTDPWKHVRGMASQKKRTLLGKIIKHLGHVDTSGSHLHLGDVCWDRCAILLDKHLSIHLKVPVIIKTTDNVSILKTITSAFTLSSLRSSLIKLVLQSATPVTWRTS